MSAEVELQMRWAGKFHRVRYSGSQGERLRGWNVVSYCGAWENLGRANPHHQRRARTLVRIADRPRLADRCLNCARPHPSRDSRWPAPAEEKQPK